MQEIKRISVWSVAKVTLLFGLLFGLLMGLYASLVLPKVLEANPDLAAQMGVVSTSSSAVVFVTVLITYTILMFISGLVGALLYNLFAKWVGGIKINLTESGKKK